MADLLEVLWNLAGWIVAGLVTLGGVWLAHKMERTSVTRKEDLDRVYGPLLKEFNDIMATEKSEGITSLVKWSPSEEFRVMKNQGLLLPLRHEHLRKDVAAMEELNAEFDRLLREFWKSVSETVNTEHSRANERLIESYERTTNSEPAKSANGGALKLTSVQTSILSTVAYQLKEDLSWSVFLNDNRYLEDQLADKTRYFDCYKYGKEEEHAVTEALLHDQSMAIFNSATKLTEGLRTEYMATRSQFLKNAQEVRHKLEKAVASGGRGH